MSYILDALKKAERERGMAKVPTLSTVHDIQSIPRSRIWMIAAAFLVFSTILFWLFFFRAKTNEQTTSLQPEKNINDNSVSAPLSTRQSPGTSETNTHSKATGPAESTPPIEEDEEGIGPEEVMARIKEYGVTHVPQNRPAQEPRPYTARSPSPPPPMRGGINQYTVTQTAQTPASGAAENPDSLRDAISKMDMTIVVYADAKAGRLVFINGRKYTEGEYINDNYLIESITMEGAVLSFQGERMLLRPKQK